MKRLCAFLLLLTILLAAMPGPAETDAALQPGRFDFDSKTVLLNSGYRMPVMGLGTYALDDETCVNSVMALIENGGRSRLCNLRVR